MNTLEEKIAMIEGYILAKGWEQAPMLVDQSGCVDSYEQYKASILKKILGALQKKESFLDVYEKIKENESKKDINQFENDEEYFNHDLRNMYFENIDSILDDNVDISFYQTSHTGMIDIGNYETLHGRGDKFKEMLKKQKEEKNNRRG